ncbi:hypothetical protein ACLOJK_031408 [Asimina triloba]
MCILCVVQKWSRRVATMLPWLVIPLIALWALSQLLPPSFRVEVTSPRLACVVVLLVTLLWYEVLMPQLSAWRARRTAQLKERQRTEALVLQKLRKTATRRCRNCLTPYRDQNPCGGRFMCSYCGHVSKRPVLDMPNAPGKMCSGWICGGPEWGENGSWAPPKQRPWVFGDDERCSAEKSYSGAVVFVCRMLGSFFLFLRWLWRKVFRIGSLREGDSSGPGSMSSKKGENGGSLNESKGEKARRKAEEKRQARLERELLEEEERKQREEVARLVEEQRRLRDEQTGAGKEQGAPDKDGESRKENVRRQRQERKKDKDKGSSKSNSDVEDLEKKGSRASSRESESKREAEKRASQSSETGNNILKGATANSVNRASSGSRYFDHMKGSFFPSSKSCNGAGFFGRDTYNSASTATKVNKTTGFRDHVLAFGNRKEVHAAEHRSPKLTLNADYKTTKTACNQPVLANQQLQPTVPKKSWQQLFTRSSTVFPCSDVNPLQLHVNQQTEARNFQLPVQPKSTYHHDSRVQIGLPLPFTETPHIPTNSISSGTSQSVFPLTGMLPHDFPSDEAELFEDPCYVPDPVSLLGPVSESLDNFPLDIGIGSVANKGLERPYVVKNVTAPSEVIRPSPIESPMSRSRVAEERNNIRTQHHCTPKSWDPVSSPLAESSNSHEVGTWQMWTSPPLCQDGLGLIGGPTSWLPVAHNKSNQEDIMQPFQNEGTSVNQLSLLESSPANCWAKNGWAAHGPGEAAGNSTLEGPLTGGQFSSIPSDSIPVDCDLYKARTRVIVCRQIWMASVKCDTDFER